MAFFVLMGLIAILIVYISVAKKKKRALLISVVILGMFYLYVRHTCGSNSADVKVMKPMAEKISEYIVKNGIPESLKDIPDLPYELEGCEKEIVYADEGYTRRTYRTEKSQWEEKVEICHFKNITLRFRLAKDLIQKDAMWDGNLRMNSNNDTTLFRLTYENKNRKFIFDDIRFSGKKDGICTTLRQ